MCGIQGVSSYQKKKIYIWLDIAVNQALFQAL